MLKKVLLVAALSCGSAAFAQIHKMEHRDSTVTERNYNLNPVVVTGSGHHQRLKSTATPVRVLSAQEIHEQGISTFDGALTRMMPQVSMSPNSMGTFLRLNGLGNKYILILVNGQKLTGDISNNIDLNRINMARVKRIEVLDGAASSLYGSDAIAGVINIITDQPTQNLVNVTSDTRVSGKGQLTEAVTLDIFAHGFGSYTSFTHDRADSYRINGLEYVKGSDTETQPSIAPLFTGYRSSIVGQKFTYAPNNKLALNAGFDYSYKITDRPNTNPDVTGGTDYEMQYKGFRWNVGGIYKFTTKNSLQATFTADRFRYGKDYDVATKSNEVGDFVLSKKQHAYETDVKSILGLVKGGTTIFGMNWRKDCLFATSGNIDQSAHTLGELRQPLHTQSHADVCPRSVPFPRHLLRRFPCARIGRALLSLLLRQSRQAPNLVWQQQPQAREEQLFLPQCRVPHGQAIGECDGLHQPHQRHGGEAERGRG